MAFVDPLVLPKATILSYPLITRPHYTHRNLQFAVSLYQWFFPSASAFLGCSLLMLVVGVTGLLLNLSNTKTCSALFLHISPVLVFLGQSCTFSYLLDSHVKPKLWRHAHQTQMHKNQLRLHIFPSLPLLYPFLSSLMMSYLEITFKLQQNAGFILTFPLSKCKFFLLWFMTTFLVLSLLLIIIIYFYCM